MRMKRYSLVGYSLFLSVVSIVLLDVAIGAPPAPSVRQRDSSPDARISGFHLVETKGGIKLWEIWGDLAEVYEKEGIARVTKVSNQVTVTLYSNEGKLTSRSDKATLNMRTKDVRLEGNVSAASEQGSSLQTQSLDWSAENRRLFTRSAVTLVRGGLVSRGVGMEAETDLERARLLSRVQSRVISQSAGVVTQDVPFVRKGGTR